MKKKSHKSHRNCWDLFWAESIQMGNFFWSRLGIFHLFSSCCISILSTPLATVACTSVSTFSNLLSPSSEILDAWREQIVEELQGGFGSFVFFLCAMAQTAIKPENHLSRYAGGTIDCYTFHSMSERKLICLSHSPPIAEINPDSNHVQSHEQVFTGL